LSMSMHGIGTIVAAVLAFSLLPLVEARHLRGSRVLLATTLSDTNHQNAFGMMTCDQLSNEGISHVERSGNNRGCIGLNRDHALQSHASSTHGVLQTSGGDRYRVSESGIYRKGGKGRKKKKGGKKKKGPVSDELQKLRDELQALRDSLSDDEEATMEILIQENLKDDDKKKIKQKSKKP